MHNHHYFRLVFIINFKLLLIIFNNNIYAESKNEAYDSIHIYTSKYLWAIEKLNQFPDECFEIFKESYAFFGERRDTSKMISSLISLSDLSKNKGKYATTFDYLWEALYLAKEQQNHESLAVIHRKLSSLYDLYDMVDDSMDHLQQAISESKRIYTKGDNNTAIQLNVSYMNLAFKKRRLGDFKEALKIIDSCILDSEVLKSIPWFKSSYESEKANLQIKLGLYNEARKSIELAEANIVPENVNARLLTNRRRGELCERLGKQDSAIIYYTRCLTPNNKNKTDAGQRTEVLELLSDIYFKQSKYLKAFTSLRSAKEIADSLSKIRSSANSEIFKINNSFQESLLKKEAMISRQNEIIKNKTEIQLRLKIIIGLLLALIGTFTIVIRMRSRLKKTVEDSEKTKIQAVLEKEQNETQIKLKNQELTAYALQLIDKESTVRELLTTIKSLSKDEFTKLEGKYKTGSQSLWEEFNIRFTEVNSDFYERLTAKCPELSRTEQKHCALIRLNFSTKEMAQILNVEGHTINISRSRIRKKLRLDRESNLSKYIAEI